MVSVAEQFGNLRQTLGSVLGIFTLLRWLRTLFAKVTGRPPPADAMALTPANFAAFTGSSRDAGGQAGASPRPSKKPFIMFMLAVFGLPYLMGKLIKALAKSQEEEEKKRLAGNQVHTQQGQQQLDPSKLDFCRLLYDFPPPDQPSDPNIDLSVKRGDLVAVLSKTDPMGEPSEWWRCRARDGRMGYLPSVYLETIQRRQPAAAAAAANNKAIEEGRAQTMSSTRSAPDKDSGIGSSGPSSRANTMPAKVESEAVRNADRKDLESFQKGHFYS